MKHKFLPFLALLFATATGTAQAQVIANSDNLGLTRNGYGNPTTGDVREIWTNNSAASFHLHQTVTLPNGVYTLQAQAVYRADYNAGTETNCILFAETGGKVSSTRIHNMGDVEGTSDGTNLGSVTSMMENAETYLNKVDHFVVSNGEVTVGMRSTGQLTYCFNGYWFIWKNSSFRLSEVTDVDVLQQALAEVKAEAQDAVDKATDETEKTTLQTAINGAEATSAGVAALQSALLAYRINTATPSQPADLTYLLKNPSFEQGNETGWTLEGRSKDTGVFGNFSNHSTGNFDYHLFNTWDVGFGISQTVKELPDGLYTLTAGIASDVNNKVVVFANDRSETFTVTDAAGIDVSIERFPITNGELTFGTSRCPNWYKVDNFRLTYLGFDPTEIIKIIAENLEKAKAIDQSHLTLEVKEMLIKAMETAQAIVDKNEGTKNELNGSVQQLTTALTAAQKDTEDYAAIEKAVTETEKTWYGLNYPGLAALTAVVEDVKAALAGQTFDKERDIAKLNAAAQAYLRTASPQDGENVDFTAALTNPSFETGDLTGWTLNGESNDTGIRENSNGTYTMSNADGNYLYNSWSKQYGISQTVTDLPEGVYALSLLHATDNRYCVVPFANDREEIVRHFGDKGTGTRITLDNLLIADGTLNFGTRNIDHWGKLDDFRLTYYGKDKTRLMAVIEQLLGEADAMFVPTEDLMTDEATAIAQARTLTVDNTADELMTGAKALQTAVRNLRNAYETEEASLDATAIAMENADFSDGINGWTITGIDASNVNNVLKNGEHYDGDGANRYFNPEQWGANNWNTSAAQALTLPAGSYRLSVSARASGNADLTVTVNRNGEVATQRMVISENNTNGQWGRGGWNRYHVYFTVTEGDKMEVVLNGQTGANHQWMSFDDVEVKALSTFLVGTRKYPAVTVLGRLDNPKANNTLNALFADKALTSVNLKGVTATAEATFTAANPNLLVIDAAEGITVNEAINVNNGVADAAVALDDNFAFGAPAAVQGEVTYTRPFNVDALGNPTISNENGVNGWQSVVVPFDVTSITAMQNGTQVTLVPTQKYDKTDDTQRPFWLYEVVDGVYKAASSIRANVPYLMSVPNDANLYIEKLNISGDVTFHGEGLTATALESVALTTPAYTLTPNFGGQIHGANIYALNEAGSLWAIATEAAPAKSFEAYASLAEPKAEILSFGIFKDEEATGLRETLGEAAPAAVTALEGGVHVEGFQGTVNVYTTDGRTVASVQANGSAFIRLQKGAYIVCGHTLLVK